MTWNKKLEEMNKFLGSNNLQKLSQDELEYLNSQFTI